MSTKTIKVPFLCECGDKEAKHHAKNLCKTCYMRVFYRGKAKIAKESQVLLGDKVA